MGIMAVQWKENMNVHLRRRNLILGHTTYIFGFMKKGEGAKEGG